MASLWIWKEFGVQVDNCQYSNMEDNRNSLYSSTQKSKMDTIGTNKNIQLNPVIRYENDIRYLRGRSHEQKLVHVLIINRFRYYHKMITNLFMLLTSVLNFIRLAVVKL